ncbi:MAG: hypothetical protein M3N35_03315, partial [Candidatus Binatota bacterium]|nr:hypothetical protein [Candidatus Binatota bacterium]
MKDKIKYLAAQGSELGARESRKNSMARPRVNSRGRSAISSVVANRAGRSFCKTEDRKASQLFLGSALIGAMMTKR